MRRGRSRDAVCTGRVVLVALLTAWSPAAWLQETSSSQGAEEIVVTGSRLPTSEKDTAQDVKIYTREQLDASGQSTLIDFLNTLPDVSTQVTENGYQTLDGATTVRLHGLPVGTTLVLVNGRRVGTSGAAQANGLTFLDLNTIPVGAVDRIEVLSEGSSAIYGSDAIAGVLNIILKKDFSGIDVNARYGEASRMHADDADITWGHRWDRGSLTVVGTYQKRTELAGFDRDLTNDQDYRRYGGRNADFFVCPDLADIYSVNGSNLPGVGAPYAGVPANYKGPPTQQEFAATAGKLNQCSVFRYASRLAGTDRAGVLLDGVFNPTESIQIYTDVLFSYVRQSVYNSPLLMFGAPGFQVYKVSAANPFNPFGETVGVSEMVAALGRDPEPLTTSYINPVLGARGPVYGTWNWDLSISQSADSSHHSQVAFNSTGLQAALNSPTTASALNPFVAGPLGPLPRLQSLQVNEPFDYLGRANVVNGVVRGRPLKLPAGALEVAVGGEYERDTLYESQFFFPGPAQRTEFHRDSYAFFTEGRVPILQGPIGPGSADRLALTVAGRFDHYSDFGDKSTPQLGAEWRPYEPVLVRATYSRSFRAPDLIDLYFARQTSTGVISDPLRGNVFEIANITIGGNPQLQPERGRSWTVGAVYSDHALDDLRLAITYWSIDETDAIQELSPQVIANNAALFPGAVTRAACQGEPPCPITAVTATFTNFGDLKVTGLDYQLTLKHRTPIGTFSPSIAATQTFRYTTSLTPGSPSTDAVSAGQDTGDWAPRWKGSVGLGWQYRGWSANATGRYVSRYQDYDSTHAIGNFWLADANARYAIGRALAADAKYWKNAYVRVAAINLFNRLPQFSNYEADLVGYDPSQADIRGRFVYAQVGTRW